MTKASDNKFAKLIIQEAADDGSDFSNPDADYRVLFLGEDGDLHLMDSSGTVTDVGGAGGNTLSSTLVTKSDNQNVAGSGTTTPLSWTDEVEDDAGCWAIGTPTKFVIPVGLNGRRARFYGQALFTASTTGNYRRLDIVKGGTTLIGTAKLSEVASGTSMVAQVFSHVITLATGDEFTLDITIDGTGIGVTGSVDFNHFGMYTVD